MDQNVKECTESIKRIKRNLEELGIDYIINENDILCKLSKFSLNKKILKLNTSNTNCKCNGSIIDTSKECPYKVGCNVSISECPLHIHKCNCSNNSTNVSTGNYSNIDYDCLFRIKPSDIQNGITLYAIMLHGETCELKMLFKPNKNGEKELIDTILFLV